MAHVQIIIGSTRPGRLGKPLADWLYESVKDNYADTTFELVDIAEYNLPLLDESNLPAMQKYEQAHTKKWAETIAKADGYVFVTPEYNHAPASSLTNAVDYLFMEWKYKPVAFFGYGAMGGVRAIEQLINQAVGVNLFPLRDQLHVFEPWAAFDESGGVKPANIKGDIDTTIKTLIQVAESTQSLRS